MVQYLSAMLCMVTPFESLLTHCHNAKGTNVGTHFQSGFSVMSQAQAYMSNRECEGWVGMTFQHEVGTSEPDPGSRPWGMVRFGFLCRFEGWRHSEFGLAGHV